MEDNDNLEANLENIRISELPETNTVDKDADFLPVVKPSVAYTSGYKTYKVTPAKLLAEAVEYTAGDHIAISANNEISATYKAGTNITIDNDGTISAAGGGSNVEVTQIQSTGTKIATITVDSVGTDLYAPNGGGGASALDDLSDVSIDTSTLASGQVIKYDGTSWVNGTESGGGSTVSVTQIQSAGTKIATITVDSVDTDLYAPNGGGSDGHTILDDEGTSLTQRDDLQFKGAYSEDDSTDGKTVVNVVRSMTKAEFDELTAEEKTGLINITDEISGGLKYVKETLYSNIDESSWTVQSAGDTLTLTDNILDYDEIYFESAFWEVNNSTGKKLTHFVMSMIDHDTIKIAYDKSGSATYDGMFDVCPTMLTTGNSIYTFGLSMQVPTTTSLKIQGKYVGGWNPGSWGITRIIGIKYLSDSEHTYSEDEQIVGTWIDGSTLYEKTISTNNSSVDLTSLGISTLAKIEGVIQHTNGKVTPISYESGASDWAVPVYDVSSKILSLAGAGTSQGGTWVLTIRYTKIST